MDSNKQSPIQNGQISDSKVNWVSCKSRQINNADKICLSQSSRKTKNQLNR